MDLLRIRNRGDDSMKNRKPKRPDGPPVSIMTPRPGRKARAESVPDGEFRSCTACGQTMIQGYCIRDGEEYFCSDECLETRYSPAEYVKLYHHGDAYWSQWI